MDNNLLITLMREGGGFLLRLATSARRGGSTEPTKLESPEEAFHRLYSPKTPNPAEELKLKAAEKAMEAVDEELKKAEESKEITEGTACVPCSSDHFSTCAGILSDEAVRMARRKGITDDEVVKRILHCSDQLNSMEREDLSAEKIANLPKWEKEIAIYAQNKGAEIRHKLNDIKSVDELESIAVELKQARDKIGGDYIRGRLREGIK